MRQVFRSIFLDKMSKKDAAATLNAARPDATDQVGFKNLTGFTDQLITSWYGVIKKGDHRAP